ncbi:MAG: DUF5710 domain-containing protein [Methylococcales bacterium]
MADSKIYLNVPYAEKDAAKALGAKWDAGSKKWYVPGNVDMAVFAKWHIETTPSTTAASKTATTSPVNSPAADKAATGVITYPTAKDFAAYNGDAPPWD